MAIADWLVTKKPIRNPHLPIANLSADYRVAVLTKANTIAGSFTTTIICVATIFRRRHTVGLLELMSEVAFIEKANAIHDLLHAQKRVAQQLFRLTKSDLFDELIWRDAGLAFKEMAQA